jgi:endo-1,4-beta-D-glucanase Y
MTTNVLTTHELRAQYEEWKTRFIERCPQGDARMRYPESGNDTRSEGVGYGMVIAAYFGDQATFDGLWDYYQRASQNGLMNWRRDGCNAGGGGGDTGSASDADIDAAFGLIVAARQWGGPYAGDATTLVGRIRGALFQAGCQGILLAGSTFAACGCINPSYIPTGYYPAFGTSDTGQGPFWTTARTNSYTFLAAAANDATGLVPAWSNSNVNAALACPGQPQVSGGGNTNEFQADAARTPWRVAVDYLWTGDARARTFLADIGEFASSQRKVQIVTRYALAGNALEGNGDATGFRSTYTVGGFASAMTATSQDELDAFTGAWQTMYLAGDSTGANNVVSPRAFNSSLALLYGLTVTGLMWDPAGANPTPVQEVAVTEQPGNLLRNGDFEQGFLGWSFANLDDPATAGARAEGFAMHKGQELEIRVERASAGPDDAFEVRLSQPVAVQAGRNYLISFKARAAAPRPISVSVALPDAPYTTFGALGNRRDPEAPVTIGTDSQTFEWVFASAGAAQAASFNFDVGNSDADLVIDDVFFGETDRPVSVAGEGAGEPTTPPPGTPPLAGTPGATPPAAGGGGTTPPFAGGGTTIPNQDLGSTPGGTPGAGAPSGGQPAGGDNGIPINGAYPVKPTGTVNGTGVCRTDTDCAGTANAVCSTKLWLCYDRNTGYVWDGSVRDWTEPPQRFDADGDGITDDDCGMGNVFWPLVGRESNLGGACYNERSGYAFNESNATWLCAGDNYQYDRDCSAEEESSCAVSSVGSSNTLGWSLTGLLGAMLTIGVRRRSRSAR